MALSTIRRRNGELTDFDRTRIEDAILAAATAVNESCLLYTSRCV